MLPIGIALVQENDPEPVFPDARVCLSTLFGLGTAPSATAEVNDGSFGMPV